MSTNETPQAEAEPTAAIDCPPTSEHNGNGENSHAPKASLFALALGSVGVVYGDIGTSPLYALRESLAHVSHGGLAVTRTDVLGIVSLLIWALIFVVTIKYVWFLMRCDNKGEGGTLSLMALAQRAVGKSSLLVTALGIAGASLFFGDAIITPAISVLSAVEGLKLVTPVFEPYILHITIAILIVLFAVQSHGTGSMAKWFGPITAIWFIVMGVLGAIHIGDDIGILHALNPVHAVSFFFTHGKLSFIVMGSVFLAVTGAEALYADMGHFGYRPIKLAWYYLVFPALALNYLGQGALVLHTPEALENPFYLLAPDWFLLPLVLLATIATVIASQAVITGAFSLTQQAAQLGLLPRMEIRHTSETQQGQIYLPKINRMLLIGVILLVALFKTSSNLASAYGIAVSATMLVSVMLGYIVIRHSWKWSTIASILFVSPFFLIDLAFFSANALKVADGGYIPVTMGFVLFTILWTWVKGTRILVDKTHKDSIPVRELFSMLERNPPHRVPGTAIFLTSDPEVAPAALMHNLKHNRVLHDHNVVLTIKTEDSPRVPIERRTEIESINDFASIVTLHFGYMETPNIPKALAQCRKLGLKFDIMSTSFFLGRRNIKASARSGMPMWQDHLYIAMAKDAANATDFFQIPTGRVIELGTQITI